MVLFVIRTGIKGCPGEDCAVSGPWIKGCPGGDCAVSKPRIRRCPGEDCGMSGTGIKGCPVEDFAVSGTYMTGLLPAWSVNDLPLNSHISLYGVIWQSSQWRPVTSTTPQSVWVWNDSHHSGDSSLATHDCLSVKWQSSLWRPVTSTTPLSGCEMTVITVETRH